LDILKNSEQLALAETPAKLCKKKAPKERERKRV
jgi:hypothetical protein